jgi:hypothetical protein
LDPIKTECESLKDLKAILDEAKEWGVQLLVIGGWAVNAHVGAYRYTKDIDLVMKTVDLGSLKALLKHQGYQVEDREIYVAGQKETDDVVVKSHISVGDIVDTSRGFPLKYSIGENAYRDAPLLTLKSYHLQCREYELEAPILPLNNLFIAKLLPVGRDLDLADVVSMILQYGEELQLDFVANEVKKNDLTNAIQLRIEDVSRDVISGKLDEIWRTQIATRLSKKDLRQIRIFLRELISILRRSTLV